VGLARFGAGRDGTGRRRLLLKADRAIMSGDFKHGRPNGGSGILRLGFLLGLALLLGACIRFDNPAENQDGAAQGELTVTVAGVDPGASVLAVELIWLETGQSGEDVLRKLIEVDGQTAEYQAVFPGLAAGAGRARAGTFIGSTAWQDFVESRNVAIAESAADAVDVTLGAPDGDLDFETDGDVADGAEEEETDGDLDDAEADDDEDPDSDGDVDETEPEPERPIFDAPYTPADPILQDQELGEAEWGYAESIVIPTSGDPVRFYAMHSLQSVFIGLAMPFGTQSPGDETPDRAIIGFDPDPETVGDEFTISFTRGEPQAVCEALNQIACRELPNGIPVPAFGMHEYARGWQVELRLGYVPLDIARGFEKTLGFAVFAEHDGEIWRWPFAYSEPADQDGWGLISSSDLWDFREYPPDGDEDEEELDPPDEEPEDLDEPEEEPEPEPEAEEEDAEIDEAEPEEGEPGFCEPGTIVCDEALGQPRAGECNDEGTDYNFDICDDLNYCTDDFCSPSQGGCYTESNNLPCDDGLNCTENDQCSSGSCSGDPMNCNDDNPCTDDSQNPAKPECCVHANRGDLTPCDDGRECTINTSCLENPQGVAVCQGGDLFAGCCDGFPDMMRLQGEDFCVDIYEAVIGDYEFVYTDLCQEAGPGIRYGALSDDYPAGFPDSVTAENETFPLFACNNAGLRPSARMTWYQARRACENVGKRLCTLSEWQRTCGGATLESYPYGSSYEPATCAGADLSGQWVPSGSQDQCGRDGVYDLSGNFEEWTEDRSVCGGGYNDSETNLTCQSCPTQSATQETSDRSFRCCADPL